MTENEKTIKFNELLVSISTNMILHETENLKKNIHLKDLSFQEIHTIELIGNLGTTTMGELAKASNVTGGTMSVMIKKLVKKGLVERKGSQEDLRVIKVKLTGKGKKAHEEHKKMHMKATRKWLSVVSDEEQEIMLTVLNKINRFLST